MMEECVDRLLGINWLLKPHAGTRVTGLQRAFSLQASPGNFWHPSLVSFHSKLMSGNRGSDSQQLNKTSHLELSDE